MDQQDDTMDTSRLSQKELLILLNERYGRLEKQISDHTTQSASNYKEFIELRLEVAKMKTQLKTWSAVVAFIAATIASIITRIIST